MEQWPALKPALSFGQLPTFQDGQLLLNQSNAIYRYLARKLNLYGVDKQEAVRCDMIQEALVDARNNLGALYWKPDFENVRDDFEANDLRVSLNRLQNLLSANQKGSGFRVGEKISYVDYMAWHHLDYIRPFAAGTLSRYPLLTAFKQRIESRPRIAAYLRSDRRPKTLTVAMASFGGTPQTS